jgi:pSer/pThr/pTyr-binding forkhead associated (FHA) protein
MVAITVNALYTSWRKRGTTRQLATAIICCVASALLLLPALLWLNLRFSALQASVSALEIALMLVYVSLWGCVVPFSTTAAYCLFTRPRDSNTAFRVPRPRSKRTTVGNAVSIVPSASAPAGLPTRQPGQPAPFVYAEDTPWGWLVHRNGRFQGLRLALKRAVVTIGRDEENDIWLDDETSSRFHAELAWQNGQPYVTDYNSLNGILLNGRRMRGTLLLSNGDFVEIGVHRFLFELAPLPASLSELDDPLLPHLRRPLTAAPSSDSEPLPARRPAGVPAFPTRPLVDPMTPPPMFASHQSQPSPQFQQPSKLQPPEAPPPLSMPPEAYEPSSLPGMCIIRSGPLVGASFPLDRPNLTVGRVAGCDVRIDDASLTIEQAWFSRAIDTDVVFGTGVYVNESLLLAPRLLQPGDMIRIGAVYLEYTPITEIQTTPLPPSIVPSRPTSSPMHLRLPSKPK